MARSKQPLGCNVLEAARQRIAWTFDTFPRVYVSFSAGKDSTVCLHLVMEEAIRRGRRVGVLLVDLEGQYALTITHGLRCVEMYQEQIDLFWVCLPLHLRNAVSQFEAHWLCWEPGREADWIRQPPAGAITDERFFPFFRRGMEFEEFVPAFGDWYSQGQLTACCVAIRADESLNRYRTVAGHGTKLDGKKWTNLITPTVCNVYPIYDWRAEDLWTYHARYPGKPHNVLYDRMHQAGLTLAQMRICQPYGDDQRRGLWLFHLIEPETWARVVARVNGANTGATYVRESGNIMGYRKITLPEGHTWQSFSELLLGSMPPKTADHFRDKIAVFLKWYRDRGYPHGIPDAPDPALKETTNHGGPSWYRICKSLLRYDYWCKGLSFTQTESAAYAKYKKLMRRRRQQWGIYG